MTNSSAYSSSILALCLRDEEQMPIFPIAERPDPAHSPILRISLDITQRDQDDLDNLDSMLSNPHMSNHIPLPERENIYCLPAVSRGLFTADPWPVGFREDEWKEVQKREVFKIDSFLRRFDNANPLQPLAEPEDQFRGAAARLTIDPEKNVTCLPIFTHGMTISYLNCQLRNRCYIIDHCALHEDGKAYVRVHCFASRRKVLDAQSSYPPFMLVIPEKLCHVRSHLDFEDLQVSSILSSPSIKPTTSFCQDFPLPPFQQISSDPYVVPSFPLPSHFSIDQENGEEETSGWKNWIRHWLCF